MYYAKFKDNGERVTSIAEGIHFQRIKNPIYNTEEIITVIGQDAETGEDITETTEPGTVIIGYGEDTFEPPIPDSFVPITNEEQELYCTGKYIRGEDGKPVKRPAYVPTLEELKVAKWDEIKAERDRRERLPLDYLTKQFDFDDISSQRLQWAIDAARSALFLGETFVITWTCYDNSTIDLTAEQVIGIPIAVAQRTDSLHQTARALREQIEVAETVEALEAIVWPE